jgi:hypothetical protein
VDGGDGPDAALGEAEADPEGVLEGGGGGVEEAGKTGGEVAAAEKGLDGGDGIGREFTEGFAVVFFVTNEEVVPTMVNDLPKGRGAGTAGLVDGRHKECS